MHQTDLKKSLIRYSSIIYGAFHFSSPLSNTLTFCRGFPDGSDGEESACSAGDLGLIAGLERFPGEGNGNLLQHSCLGNPMDRGAWQVTICVILRVKCKLVTKAHTHHHLKTAHGLTSFILFCLAKYLTSFHVLVNHLYISSGEGSMQALYPFKKLVSLSFC